MIINISKINLSGCSGGGGGDSKVISTKNFEVTANGTTNITMDQGVDGISAGTITTSVDMGPAYSSGYTEGFASGETAGAAAQKALLTSTTVTTNGTVTRENGYSAVTVNVQPTLTSATITTNGTYTPGAGVDGFNSVSVNVPQIGENKLPGFLCGEYGSVTALTENDFSEYTLAGPYLTQYNITFKSNLKSITFPNWFTRSSNQSCSYNNNLETVNLDRFVELGGNTFANDPNLSNVGSLMYLQTIGSQSFNGCKLSGHIDLMPGSNAFSNVYNCFGGNNGITSVTIHDAINVLGPPTYGGTFLGNLTNLEFVDMTRNVVVPVLSNAGLNNFTSSTKNYEIRVPQILYDEWTAATNWSTIASHIVSCPNPHSNNTLKYTTSDGQPITSWSATTATAWNGIYVSEDYDAVTGGSITMYGLTKIPESWSNNTDKRRLLTLEMPDSVLRIDGWSLNGCTAMTSLVLSENLRYNGGSVFADLYNVQTLTFGADYIGLFHLSMMTALTDVTIKAVVPPHITGHYAFSGLRQNGTFHVPAGSVSAYENWIQRIVNETSGNTAIGTWTVVPISS